MPGAVVGDDVGRADHPGGLDRHQFRVAGPEPDAPQRSAASALILRSLAIALTAAAAIALPPRRPVTTSRTCRGVGRSAPAWTRRRRRSRPGRRARRPGRARRRRPVRAAGTARSARCRSPPPRRRAGRPTAPPRPRSGWCPVGRPASAARGSATRRHHLVAGGQPGPGDPGGHHRRVAQHRRARGQRRVRLGDDVGAEGDVLGDVDLPAGVDHPHHHPRDVVGKPRQVRLGADRRERLPVDLGGVADVVEHPLTLRVACCAAGIRLRSRPAPRRRRGCRRPVRSRRSAGAPVAGSSTRGRGVGADVGGGVLAAGAAGARADATATASSRRTPAPSAPAPAARRRRRLVEVEDEHRTPRRDRPSARRPPPGTRRPAPAAPPAEPRRPASTRPSSCGIQPTGGRVTGGHVAPARAGPAKPSSSAAVSSSSLTRQACSADVGEAARDRHQRRRRRRPARLGRRCRGPASSSAAESPTTCITDVGAQPGDVAAAVVDAEQEPARAVRPARARPGSRRPARCTSRGYRRLRRLGPTAGTRRCCAPARGSATAAGPPPATCVGHARCRDAADLDVAPRGQFHRRRAQTVRRVRQRLELGAADHPARQPHPSQRAVGGLVHLQARRGRRPGHGSWPSVHGTPLPVTQGTGSQWSYSLRHTRDLGIPRVLTTNGVVAYACVIRAVTVIFSAIGVGTHRAHTAGDGNDQNNPESESQTATGRRRPRSSGRNYADHRTAGDVQHRGRTAAPGPNDPSLDGRVRGSGDGRCPAAF